MSHKSSKAHFLWTDMTEINLHQVTKVKRGGGAW